MENYILQYDGMDLGKITRIEKDFPTIMGKLELNPNWKDSVKDPFALIHIRLGLKEINEEEIESQLDAMCEWIMESDLWTVKSSKSGVQKILIPTINLSFIAWRWG